MKALVISDRQEIIDFVTPLLKENGFDLIHYRWIIKALDNIEEIQPDVIVLSAIEYPRQWKTLAGFVQSGIGGNDVKVYLYDTQPLSDDENKKALELDVMPFEKAFKKRRIVDVEIALNNPQTGILIFTNGKYFPDDGYVESDEISAINDGFVNYVTLYDGNCVTAFSADVEKKDSKTTCLIAKEYYEKEI